jgi:hypothetical protein
MGRIGLKGLFVFSLLLFEASVGLSQGGVVPYAHEIKIADKKIGVSQEELNSWRKKVVSRAGPGTTVSRAKIEALAKEFGLMQKTSVNPSLVFLSSDIKDWEKRKLDETHLALEFAARRLILEEADIQRISIPGKEALSKAATQVIPLIQEQQKEQQSSLVQDLVCTGSTSEEFVKQSWDGLTNNHEKSLACTDKTIRKWARQADDQQAKATNQSCGDPPPASDLKPYFASYWALSDVATSWFIRGEVFSQQKKWPEAKAAYKTVIDKYRCSFTWDPRGWFWRTSDGAQEKYDEIRPK